MIRRMYFAGLTANQVVTPPVGFKWRILWINLVLTTGATAGSRSMTAYPVIPTGTNVAGAAVVEIPNQTGINQSYIGAGFATDLAGTSGASIIQFKSAVIIGDGINLTFIGQLQSGDTYQFDILVEEKIDEAE